MLTAERLHELLNYNPATGLFTWTAQRGPARAGSIAGSVRKDGRRTITIDYERHFAHRLAWLHVHGEWPPGDLDHKDNCPGNDWISNLRPATESQNLANSRRPSNNTSGFKGVSWHCRDAKWQANICKDGRQFHLGSFGSAEDAHAAYCAAANELFGEFARVS